MINVAVVGLGYWGPNLVRVFHDMPTAELVACCDLDGKRIKNLALRYPDVRMYDDLSRLLLAWPSLDALAIATPMSTHYDLVADALDRGLHVFVEKPLADSFLNAAELVCKAGIADKVLAVGHVFLYHPAVVKMRTLLESQPEEFGAIRYIEASREHLGGFHGGGNVIWDLGPHDVSIILDILSTQWKTGDRQQPIRVSALGTCHLDPGMYNTVYANLSFDRNIIVNIRWNWLSATKVRRMVIGCEHKTIIYNDVDIFEQVKIYDASVKLTPDFLGDQSIYHKGDLYIPQLPKVEPLMVECTDFIHSIESQSVPYSSGEKALDVLEILERIQRSVVERTYK